MSWNYCEPTRAAELEAALRLYADPAWYVRGSCPDTGFNVAPPAITDGGASARAVLSAGGG